MKLQEYMVKEGKTLATAESCSGGLLAHLITKHPGASLYFLGSFVTYCNELKASILGVKKETLDRFGAVSEEVVLQMVEGVFRATKADYAIATSGIAGPDGGSEEKPVGTIWIAIGKRGSVSKTFPLHLQGSREEIIDEVANHCLTLLYNIVQKKS